MRYGIDIDGVLADFVKGFSQLGEEFKGTKYEWNLNLSEWGLGLTRAQEQKGWEKVAADPYFWTGLDVLNRFPQELLSPTDVVYFITKRKETPGRNTAQEAAKWLLQEQDIMFPTVLAIPNKGEVCRALKVDAFIDDKPENCWDVRMESLDTKVFLMEQPWNQWERVHAKEFVITPLERVKTLEEFFERSNG